jgi:uncharacterized protein YecT (DUF1311 family)
MPKSHSNSQMHQLVLLMCFCTAAAASAATSPQKESLRASYQRCIDASGGVTSSINDCIGAEADYQDKRLNSVYRSLLSKLDDKGKQKLRSDERNWIAYRDSHCAADKDSGTAGMLDSNACLLEETAKQANILEGRLFAQDLK